MATIQISKDLPGNFPPSSSSARPNSSRSNTSRFSTSRRERSSISIIFGIILLLACSVTSTSPKDSPSKLIPTSPLPVPNWTGQDVKNVLYTAARENGPSRSLWQKLPGETQGRPLGFWSRGYKGSEASYIPTEKEILAAYEGVQAASEVIGAEAQLLLAP
ncbi:hypothetical protein WISP_87914 [Willisornis vidua]|uniref:Uncharacterized protein n=1 Tax=Willisornis vidua TaxID=1566151 RepID=A0ABQ9D2V0_9PASS|nr:hypothetical protein WISP_87914 [Willisornis vidua]